MSLLELTIKDIPSLSTTELKKLILEEKECQRPGDEEFDTLGKPELERIAIAFIRKKVGIDEPEVKKVEKNVKVKPEDKHSDFPNVSMKEAENPVETLKEMGFKDERAILVQIDALRRESAQIDVLKNEHEKREVELSEREQEFRKREAAFDKKSAELGAQYKKLQALTDQIMEAKKNGADVPAHIL